MALRTRFMELLQIADITYSDLAKQSGVSAATISRIVNGASANTESLEALIAVLEKHIGNDDATKPSALPMHCVQCRADQAAREETLREHYERLLAEMDKSHARETELHERAKTYLKQRYKRSSIALGVLVGAIVIILIIDLTHGGIGWFRFSALANSSHSTINDIIKYFAGLLA